MNFFQKEEYNVIDRGFKSGEFIYKGKRTMSHYSEEAVCSCGYNGGCRCVKIILAVLGALFALVLGGILGAYLYEQIITAIAAVVVLGIVLLVSVILLIFYIICRRCPRCRC